VKNITDKHRGTIAAEAAEPQGTRFIVRLPVDAPGE
jgi:signal transduction histidine kinase